MVGGRRSRGGTEWFGLGTYPTARMATFDPNSGSQPTPPPLDVPDQMAAPRAEPQPPPRPTPPPVQTPPVPPATPAAAPPPVTSPTPVTSTPAQQSSPVDSPAQSVAPLSVSHSDAFWTRPDGVAPAPRREQLPVEDHTHDYAQQAAAWENESGEIVESAKENAPAWLASSVLHVTLMLVMALWAFHKPSTSLPDLELMSELPGQQLVDELVTTETPTPADDEQALSLSQLDEVEDPLSAPPKPDDLLNADLLVPDVSAPDIGNLFAGRQPGAKAKMLGQYGPTKGSENAVSLGLAWLVRQQQSDGSWSLVGPYPDGGQYDENKVAATAMAMLAFQGAGHTHESDSMYGRRLKKALDYLLRGQDRNGDFWDSMSDFDSHIYTHAQATIAVCELYAMTKDERLREPAQRAVDFCVKAQDPTLGGWRYDPGQAGNSDVSVTGWVMMALQSARMGGLQVPAETFYAMDKFLDRAAATPRQIANIPRFLQGSRYTYTPGEQVVTVSMTAEALLCRQYLGWQRDDPRMTEGLEFVMRPESRPDWFQGRNVYFWYYATQAFHNVGGDRWHEWNELMRDLLVEHQSKTGDDKGSWHPFKPSRDQWGGPGGRLYVTCLSLYILEVYYRHMPLYKSAAE